MSGAVRGDRAVARRRTTAGTAGPTLDAGKCLQTAVDPVTGSIRSARRDGIQAAAKPVRNAEAGAADRPKGQIPPPQPLLFLNKHRLESHRRKCCVLIACLPVFAPIATLEATGGRPIVRTARSRPRATARRGHHQHRGVFSSRGELAVSPRFCPRDERSREA